MSKQPWISSSFGGLMEPPVKKFDKDGDEQRLSKQTIDQRALSSVKQQLPVRSEELWLSKYAPSNVDDLAVHKNKIAELRHWILKALSSWQPNGKTVPILLITGESGVGKTAALQLVCKELGIQISEWVNSETESYSSLAEDVGVIEKFDRPESQSSKFSSFLFRASRYSSLGFLSEAGSAFAGCRSVILVEELPYFCTRNPSEFHGILRRYRAFGLSPIVFIVSECAGKNIEHVLFPKSIQFELCIDNIAFNPVAPTVAVKVLTKIVSAESAVKRRDFNAPDHATLQQLVKLNQGDIRSMINSLQFYCEGSSAVGEHAQGNSRVLKKSAAVVTQKAARGRQRKDKQSASSAAPPQAPAAATDETTSVGGKDSVLSLFHAVGKILHCKRSTTCDVREQLPDHLSDCSRNTLLVVPEDVVEKSHVSPDQFIYFLHQNCLDFCADCNSAVLITSSLSDSDCLTDWTVRQVLEPHRTSIACRGILFSYDDKLPTVNTPGWKPLKKAELNGVNKQLAANSFSIQNTFCRYRLSSVELNTQLLPYLANMGRWNGATEAESQLVRTVGRFSTRNFESRKRSSSDSESMIDDDDTCDVIADIASCRWSNETETTDQANDKAARLVDDDEEIVIDDYDG